MDKKVLCNKLNYMENSLERMLMEVQMVKKAMRQRLNEEVDLTLENQKLKKRLLELENLLDDEKLEASNKKIEAKTGLEFLYKDGFHICHTFYGNRFLNDEECLLCLEMLDR
ncbi:MAG: initiation control protein YabA [Streptococcaceae bacterium]|jgi:regulator of replication initiation timing|nr:initiation control protein YabA [Streptococcaceae bacterium]